VRCSRNNVVDSFVSRWNLGDWGTLHYTAWSDIILYSIHTLTHCHTYLHFVTHVFCYLMATHAVDQLMT
jgi:hypothetical protein